MDPDQGDATGNDRETDGTESRPAEPPTPFVDRVRRMPVTGELSSDLWGADATVPRDPNNGIEDPDWSYWGGDVIEVDGTYHMFVARWRESEGHDGWTSDSRIARCTATDPTGPFTFREDIAGDTYGHNPAVVVVDGTYAVFNNSPAYDVAYAASPEGPWTTASVDVESRSGWNNPAPVVREDGSIVVINKSPHEIHVGESLLAPYRSHGPLDLPDGFDYVEDWAVWKADDAYHLIGNQYDRKHAFHMYSRDALDWTLPEAFDAYVTGVTHYEDGTETLWFKMERPKVVVEDGAATALYLAAIDVRKEADRPDDDHSSKTVALPLAPPGAGGSSGPLTEGAYYVENAGSGHAMTVEAPHHGAGITQRPYERTENQMWLVTDLGEGIYRLEAMHSGIHRTGNGVLAVERTDAGTGTALVQREWTGEATQHWRIVDDGDGTHRLESAHDGRVVAVGESAAERGVGVVPSDRGAADGQRWRFEPVTYGAFEK